MGRHSCPCAASVADRLLLLYGGADRGLAMFSIRPWASSRQVAHIHYAYAEGLPSLAASEMPRIYGIIARRVGWTLQDATSRHIRAPTMMPLKPARRFSAK